MVKVQKRNLKPLLSSASTLIGGIVGSGGGGGPTPGPGDSDPNWADVIYVNNSWDSYGTLADQSMVVTENGSFPPPVNTPNKFPGYNTIFFDGTDGLELVGTGTSGSIANANDFTMEAWVYQAGNTLNKTIFAKRDGADDEEFRLTFGGTSKTLIFTAYNGAGGSLYQIASDGAVAEDEWVHVAVTRASGVVRMFINGVLQADTHTQTTAPAGNTGNIWIGEDPEDSLAEYQGFIGPVRITMGTARYTETFTPPDDVFPVDTSGDLTHGVLTHPTEAVYTFGSSGKGNFYHVDDWLLLKQVEFPMPAFNNGATVRLGIARIEEYATPEITEIIYFDDTDTTVVAAADGDVTTFDLTGEPNGGIYLDPGNMYAIVFTTDGTASETDIQAMQTNRFYTAEPDQVGIRTDRFMRFLDDNFGIGVNVGITQSQEYLCRLTFEKRTPPTGHRFWRVQVEASLDHSWATIQEIEMASEPGGTNLCTGGTPISGGNRSGWPASEAFDGDKTSTSHGWSEERNASTDLESIWVGYDFGEGTYVDVTELRMWARNNIDWTNQYPQHFRFQWSDNGIDWTTVLERVHEPIPTAGEGRTYTVATDSNSFPDTEPSATHWRIRPIRSDSVSFISILELEMAGSINGANLCTGGTPIAGDARAGWPASEAFDGDKTSTSHGWSFDLSTMTYPDDCWIGYEFASAQSIREIRWWSRNDTSEEHTPLSFYVEYSTDSGTTWNVAWHHAPLNYSFLRPAQMYSAVSPWAYETPAIKGEVTVSVAGALALADVDIPYPDGIVSGETLVAVLLNEETAGLNNYSTPAGWTYRGTWGNGTSGATINVFTKIADGTETGALTVSGTTEDQFGMMFRAENLDPDVPLSTTTFEIYISTGTRVDAGNYRRLPAFADQLLFCVFARDGGDWDDKSFLLTDSAREHVINETRDYNDKYDNGSGVGGVSYFVRHRDKHMAQSNSFRWEFGSGSDGLVAIIFLLVPKMKGSSEGFQLWQPWASEAFNSTSAFSTKGNVYDAKKDLSITKVAFHTDIAMDGNVIIAKCAVGDSTYEITEIVTTDAFTGAKTNDRTEVELASPAAITAGDRFLVLIDRTDAGDAVSNGLEYFGELDKYNMPPWFEWVEGWRNDAAAPAVSVASTSNNPDPWVIEFAGTYSDA